MSASIEAQISPNEIGQTSFSPFVALLSFSQIISIDILKYTKHLELLVSETAMKM